MYSYILLGSTMLSESLSETADFWVRSHLQPKDKNKMESMCVPGHVSTTCIYLYMLKLNWQWLNHMMLNASLIITVNYWWYIYIDGYINILTKRKDELKRDINNVIKIFGGDFLSVNPINLIAMALIFSSNIMDSSCPNECLCSGQITSVCQLNSIEFILIEDY